MTEWIDKWYQNGWRNAAGKEVVNRDLIERAVELEDLFTQVGHLSYVWIPREENEEADQAVNEAMDNQSW